jgi:hypothetical protein
MQNISTKVGQFVVSELPDYYPYHIAPSGTSGDKFRIPFFEMRGRGPPPNEDPDFGSPGDVYIDLQNPDAYAVYSKTVTNWVQWRAASARSVTHTLPASDLYRHPYFDRFLWCDGRVLSWWSRSTIKKKRHEMHKDGIYHRENNMTDESYAAVVVTEIAKRMLNYEEHGGKVKRKASGDNTGPAQKKIKVIFQTPSTSEASLRASSLSLSQTKEEGCRDTPSPSLHRSGQGATSESDPAPQDSVPYISMSGSDTPSDAPDMQKLSEERKFSNRLHEIDQRLVEENAKLQEANLGRSLTDSGSSPDAVECLAKPAQSGTVGQDATSATSLTSAAKCFTINITDVDTLKTLGSGEKNRIVSKVHSIDQLVRVKWCPFRCTAGPSRNGGQILDVRQGNRTPTAMFVQR